MQIIAGKTDVSISIYARALSGAPLTGKVAADFALTYRRAGANVPLSLSDLASVDAAHTDGGIYEVGNGEYRLDLPDAAVATGANQVSVTGTVDGGVLLGYPIQLDAERTPGGTYAQTVTVTSSGVPVQGATVQILDAADDSLIDLGTTDSSGIAVVRCNAISVKFTADKAGYTSYTSDATSVTGAAPRAVTLTALTISPPAVPTDCACAWVCLNDSDQPIAGVIVRARPDTDATGDGYAWSGHTRSATSVAGTGLATINLPQGSKWWIRAGSGEEELYTVPATTTDLAGSIRGGKRDTY
jgi:hypothetical protein